MLILALFMVLFSNYMEERLLDGKTVLRVDCHLVNPADRAEEEDDEQKTLLSQNKVRPIQVIIIPLYVRIHPLYLQPPINTRKPQVN